MRRCRLHCRLLVATAVCACLVSVTPAMAQRYQVDNMDKTYRNPREVKLLRQKTMAVMRGTQDLAVKKADVDAYYLGYLFPAMSDPEKLGELASLRLELTSDLGNCASEDFHSYLRDLAYEQSRARVGGNYHPSVRYNCALILGDLNQTKPEKSQAPIPYRRALVDLARMLNNPKLDDALLTACLIGIQRHAQLSGDESATQSLYNEPKIQKFLVSKLGQLANTTTAPDGRSAAGHQWMRQIAVESLGYLRIPMKANAVVKLLTRVATQAESPITLRCAAIEALARLDLAGSGIQGADLAETAGQVVYAACQVEYDAIDEELKENRGTMRGGRPPRASTMRPGAPGEGPRRGATQPRRPANEFIAEDPDTVPHRRRLIHQLLTVRKALAGEKREGIDGIKSMAGAEQKAASIIDIINTMLEEAEDGTTDMIAFGKKIGSAKKQVAGLIKTKPPKPIESDV